MKSYWKARSMVDLNFHLLQTQSNYYSSHTIAKVKAKNLIQTGLKSNIKFLTYTDHLTTGWPIIINCHYLNHLKSINNYWNDMAEHYHQINVLLHAIDLMHMTSQKGARVCWGSNEALPRAPSPSMQPAGQPLHDIPPGWPGRKHWLSGWAPMRSASTTRARSTTSLDPQHGVVVMETWRQCIRSMWSFNPLTII